MFKKGDYVIKLPEGVCKIEDIVHLDISDIDSDKAYYLLVPVSEKSSSIYISIDAAKERIRNVISRDEAMRLIKSLPEINEKNISNERRREQEYKSAILSGDLESLVSVMKLIYARRKKRTEEGKKVTAIDDRYFKQAENILFSELSFVLDIPKEEIETFIADTIGT